MERPLEQGLEVLGSPSMFLASSKCQQLHSKKQGCGEEPQSFHSSAAILRIWARSRLLRLQPAWQGCDGVSAQGFPPPPPGISEATSCLLEQEFLEDPGMTQPLVSSQRKPWCQPCPSQEPGHVTFTYLEQESSTRLAIPLSSLIPRAVLILTDAV